MTNRNRKSLKDVAREIGLDRIFCSCGKTVDAVKLLDELFEAVLQSCKDGDEVFVKRFGSFRAMKMKRREMRSITGKKCRVKGDHILKFRYTLAAKKLLNQG